MNHKLIISIALLAIVSCPAFGMIRRTTVAPKVTSSIAPSVILPVSNSSQLSRSYFSPSVSTFPTYDYNTAQNKYWWNQNFDQKSSWYNSKWIKYLLGAGIITGAGMEIQSLVSRIKKIVLEISYDAQDIDPELYEVFLQMKNDYGITENMQLRILFSVEEIDKKYPSTSYFLKEIFYNYLAFYVPYLDTIILREDYKKRPESTLIKSLAHELEHHRQLKGYLGSYYDRSLDLSRKKKVVDIKQEIGADAAAADYVYCSECLEEISKYGWTHQPQETEAGYITSPYGYFSQEDYKIYTDRAKEACALCPAHQKWFPDWRAKASLKDYLPPKVK